MESVKGHKFLMKLQGGKVDINCTKNGEHDPVSFYIKKLPMWVILFLLLSTHWFMKYIGTFFYPCKEERVAFEYI